MASVPSKHHQPLHNFSLPFLKWGQRLHINNNNNCRRRNRNSPHADSSDSDQINRKKHNRFRHGHRTSEHLKRGIDEESDDVLVQRSNDIEKLTDVDVVTVTVTATAADGDVKPWNLRPRRLAINTVDGNGAVTSVSSAKSGRLSRGVASVTAAVEEEEDLKKKKRRLWISLSKEEIEEDVYAFTGSKPARRPKKRNRTAQKQVDNVFPGLYLVGISADSYRV